MGVQAEDNIEVRGDYPHAVRAAALRTAGGLTVDSFAEQTVIRDTWWVTRRGGAVTWVGIGGKQDAVPFSALELLHAGSVDAESHMPPFFDWVRSGQVDLRGLVTWRGALTDVTHALDEISAGRGPRTLLAPAAEVVS